jgi:hypothetical protein
VPLEVSAAPEDLGDEPEVALDPSPELGGLEVVRGVAKGLRST